MYHVLQSSQDKAAFKDLNNDFLCVCTIMRLQKRPRNKHGEYEESLTQKAESRIITVYLNKNTYIVRREPMAEAPTSAVRF